MRAYKLTHLSDAVLLHDLGSLASQERNVTATVLAYVAEVDERRLYLSAGHPSMYAYCVGELRFSEDAAYKRIQAARAAREFPAIFAALAEGRLHLAAVCLLAPHLIPENADELLAAAAGKTKAEIEVLLAKRFPRTEPLPLLQVTPAAKVDVGAPQRAGHDQLAPGQVAPTPPPRVKPLSPERFALQFSIGQSTYDKLQYVQSLMSHQLPSGDVAQVFDRALDLLKAHLEKQKFAATAKPGSVSRRSSVNARYVPAHVKRAVWQRDRGRCTFVGQTGKRCPSRKFLEFDHIDPVARGGRPTLEGMRLRCRAHNQYEAERAFGTEFMNDKREEARGVAAGARSCVRATESRAPAVPEEDVQDVIACLRELGYRAYETRRAVEYCSTLPEATVEERVRAALRFLCPKAGLSRQVPTGSGARI